MTDDLRRLAEEHIAGTRYWWNPDYAQTILALLDERDRLQGDVEWLVNVQGERDRLRLRVAALEEGLRAVAEWAERKGHKASYCLVCVARKGKPHADDCIIGQARALLAAAPSEPQKSESWLARGDYPGGPAHEDGSWCWCHPVTIKVPKP